MERAFYLQLETWDRQWWFQLLLPSERPTNRSKAAYFCFIIMEALEKGWQEIIKICSMIICWSKLYIFRCWCKNRRLKSVRRLTSRSWYRYYLFRLRLISHKQIDKIITAVKLAFSESRRAVGLTSRPRREVLYFIW